MSFRSARLIATPAMAAWLPLPKAEGVACGGLPSDLEVSRLVVGVVVAVGLVISSAFSFWLALRLGIACLLLCRPSGAGGPRYFRQPDSLEELGA